MHKPYWRAQFFKSADVSMLAHSCGVSKYPQFYNSTSYLSVDVIYFSLSDFRVKPWPVPSMYAPLYYF